jgi:hypothetical protein
VFYKDEGLARSQQMFSDLNRYAIKPTKSINILYNSREESAIVAKSVIEKVPSFNGLVEKEKTTISNRSKALFTLSAICTATDELLNGLDLNITEKAELAISFWKMVSYHIKEWTMVAGGDMKSSDVRRDYICSLSITLVSLGFAGNALIKEYPNDWKERLNALASIDWKKSNPVWENLVFVNGKVAANRSTQRAMSSYMRSILLRLDGKVSDVRKDDELYTLLGEPISPTIEFVPALEIIGERSYCFYGNGIQVDNIAADYERLKEVMMQYNLSKAQLQAPKSKVLLPHIPQIKLPTKGARAKMLPEDSVIIEEESR